MNYHHRYAALASPMPLCLVGSGQFGQSLLAQAQRIPRLSIRLAVDRSAELAAQAFLRAGYAKPDIATCETAAEARAAHAAGKCVAVGNLDLVIDLPFDCLVEATGHPEAGARHALAAIEARRHVLMVTKETDSVVGPLLARKARQNGVLLAPVDGDQPSLLMAMVTWAETLGFDILCAGKSSEYDFVVAAGTDSVSCNGISRNVPGLAARWHEAGRDARALAEARAALLGPHFSLRAVPDLCEMTLVANATGLCADRPGFHAPVARVPELPALFRPHQAGGLLGGARRLDVFHHIRLPDEASFAGGVFVSVRCDDDASWQVLAEKGHLVSRERDAATLYLPRHLLGLEAATSLFDLALGQSPYGEDYAPLQDLVAVTTRPLAAGTRLAALGHHHTIDGVTAEMHPARAIAREACLPYYLVADRVLARDLPAGRAVSLSDLQIEPGSALLALRQEQDEAFGLS